MGRLRHVFIAERRQGPGLSAEGPTDKQAAQLMGHSTAEWDKVYDLDYSRREGEAGVAAMAQWREEMLAKAGARSLDAQVAAAEAIDIAEDSDIEVALDEE